MNLPDLELYDFLRYSTATFLIMNSIHRILNPGTGAMYMTDKVFRYIPLSNETVVFLVMGFSLLCAGLIILDKFTWQASGSIAFGITLVVLMLLIQTPYLTEATESGKFFFDIAVRDFGVVALFASLSIAARRKSTAD